LIPLELEFRSIEQNFLRLIFAWGPPPPLGAPGLNSHQQVMPFTERQRFAVLFLHVLG
jgi:hypothetical protein